ILGLEQFSLGHDQGSSHGQTRIIRTAYYEHPDYVPLVRRAFQLWYDFEQRRGAHLLTACDCLSIGTETSEVVQGVLSAAKEHRLAVESLSASELRSRYPQFRFKEEYHGILEHEAGFLLVDDCVRVMQEDARAYGAELNEEEPVKNWSANSAGVR